MFTCGTIFYKLFREIKNNFFCHLNEDLSFISFMKYFRILLYFKAQRKLFYSTETRKAFSLKINAIFSRWKFQKENFSKCRDWKLGKCKKSLWYGGKNISEKGNEFLVNLLISWHNNVSQFTEINLMHFLSSY